MYTSRQIKMPSKQTRCFIHMLRAIFHLFHFLFLNNTDTQILTYLQNDLQFATNYVKKNINLT